MNLTKTELENKYKEKYKEVALTEASDYYYGTENAMDRVLAELQNGINTAATKYEGIKENYEKPHVYVFINQDTLEIAFFIAKYEDFQQKPDIEFYRHYVGEPMVEAMVLMQMMEDSLQSTGINHATNNWVEDLDFDALGEFEGDFTIGDQYEFIEY